MNYIYLDTETTGLNPSQHSIVQLSGIIKTKDREETFNFKMKPYHNEEVDPIAAKVTGYTTEEVYTWEDSSVVFKQFIDLLDSFNITYGTKFNLVGYNVGFDSDFIREWFKINGKNWGYYVWFPYIDVMSMANLHFIGNRAKIKNFKLTTIYFEVFGRDFPSPHDALSDVKATIELFEFFCSKLYMPALRKSEVETTETPPEKVEIKVRPKKVI